MSHQPSVILLVKNKVAQAKLIRVEIRAEKARLRIWAREAEVLARTITKQTKLIEQLTARLDEVKEVPRRRGNGTPTLRVGDNTPPPPF